MEEIALMLDRNEYDLIIKALRERRSEYYWSTAIDKELIVDEFDKLIEKLILKEE